MVGKQGSIWKTLKADLVYEWNDIHGNSGIRRENIDVLSPYSILKIPFGRIKYV